MKRILYIGGGSLLLLAALLFGSFYAGPLFASAHSSSTATTQSTTSTQPTTTTTRKNAQKESKADWAKDKDLRKFVRDHKGEIIAQIAPQLHLTKDQLIAKLKSGQHLDQIAKDQKISTDQLKTIIINSTDTVITNALNAKKIDQQHATDLMNRVKANPFVVGHVLHRQYNGHRHDSKNMKANSKKSAGTKNSTSTSTASNS